MHPTWFCFQFSGHSGDRCTLIIKGRKPPPPPFVSFLQFCNPDHRTPFKPSINIIRPQRGRRRENKKTDLSGWTCVLYKFTAGGINATGWQSWYQNQITCVYIYLRHVTHILGAEVFGWNPIHPVILKSPACSSL